MHGVIIAVLHIPPVPIGGVRNTSRYRGIVVIEGVGLRAQYCTRRYESSLTPNNP